MDKVPNAWIRKLCGVAQGVNRRTDDSVLPWFGHMEKMENDRNAKRVSVGKWQRMMCGGFGRSILRIYVIWI